MYVIQRNKKKLKINRVALNYSKVYVFKLVVLNILSSLNNKSTVENNTQFTGLFIK